MNQKTQRTILAGIAGVVVMSIFIMISPFLGLVKLLPAEILSQSMGLPSVVALSLHFVFGIFSLFFKLKYAS